MRKRPLVNPGENDLETDHEQTPKKRKKELDSKFMLTTRIFIENIYMDNPWEDFWGLSLLISAHSRLPTSRSREQLGNNHARKFTPPPPPSDNTGSTPGWFNIDRFRCSLRWPTLSSSRGTRQRPQIGLGWRPRRCWRPRQLGRSERVDYLKKKNQGNINYVVILIHFCRICAWDEKCELVYSIHGISP